MEWTSFFFTEQDLKIDFTFNEYIVNCEPTTGLTADFPRLDYRVNKDGKAIINKGRVLPSKRCIYSFITT